MQDNITVSAKDSRRVSRSTLELLLRLGMVSAAAARSKGGVVETPYSRIDLVSNITHTVSRTAVHERSAKCSR